MRKNISLRFFVFCLLVGACLCGEAQVVQKIKGKVVDSIGTPIPSANVQLKGKSGGTSTLQDGSFSISAPTDGILVISAVGFTSKQIAVNGKTDMSVALSVNNRSMDEVVVTALGVRREKRNLTFASQEIKGDELVRAEEPNVLNAMTGKLAGVEITSTSGAPGGASAIVIRGITSLYGNNQALIVLDGVPINNDETDGGGGGGAGSNRLSDIDPNIIESINVLKGAAATALYGSAGARGVVLITTKGGSRAAQKPTFTVSSSVSGESAILPPRQMTYAQGSDGQYVDGTTAKTSTSWGPRWDTLYENGVKVPFYNQLKLFMKEGLTNNNTISVGGGSATSNYFASYSYYDQTGTVPDTYLKRHNLFTKFTNQVTKNFTITSELTYVNSENHLIDEGYGLTNPLVTVYIAPISYNLLPYENPDGSQRLYRYSRDNPYWVLNNIENTSGINRFVPVFNLSYAPLPWLTLTERLGADIYMDKFNYHINKGEITYVDGELITQNENFRQYNHDLIAQARKSFNKLDASLLIGNNVFSTHSDYMKAVGTDLSVAGYYNMANASTVTYSESNYLSRKVGFYAQTELEYDHTYILSGSFREDGSSVLSTNHMYYPYGSIAGGFIFSELLNGKAKDIIPFGKLRASYAVVGNDNVNDYSNTTPYVHATTNVTFPYDGQNGFLTSSTLGNTNLKNELQHEFEIGLETKLFNNRVGFEASWYDRRMTDGLVQNVQLAYSTGYGYTTINSAKLSTKAVELLLTATPVRTRNFSWDITINFSNPKTIVKQIMPGTDLDNINFIYAAVGHPYGMFYGTKYARDAQGNLMLNGGLPYDATDEGFLGTSAANWTGGITNQFHYKQFGFSFFIDTRQGGMLENTDEYYNQFYGVSKVTEQRQDRIVKGTDVNTNKANAISVTAQSYYQTVAYIQESLMQHADYIKLRNVTLSYDLNRAVLKSSPFKSATLTLTGRNLWIHHASDFTGSDPESTNTFGTANSDMGEYTFGTPTSRSYGATVKFTF